MPLESSLAFHYPLYGYAESSRMGRHLLVRENETKARIQQLQQQEAQIRQTIFTLAGQLDILVFDRRTFVSGVDDAVISEEEMKFTARLPVANEPLPQSAPAIPKSGLVVPNTRPTSEADFADNPDAALLRKKANGPLPKEGI